MISHEFKFIFIHIPRTGGTSIEHAFGVDMWKQAPYNKHLSASETRKKCGEKIWEQYFKFSIVRNPWDRVISMWKSSYYGKNYKTLYDFLLFYEPPEHEYNSNFYNCVDVLDDEIDYIAKFEFLQQELKKISDKLGTDIRLSHHENTQHEHYSKYYDVRTKAIVDHLYKKDIKYYGYNFEDCTHERNNNLSLKTYKTIYLIKFKFDLLRVKLGLLTKYN